MTETHQNLNNKLKQKIKHTHTHVKKQKKHKQITKTFYDETSRDSDKNFPTRASSTQER